MQIVVGLTLALMGLGISVFTFIAAAAGALPYFVAATGLVLGGLVMASHGRTRLEMCQKANPTDEPHETDARDDSSS